MHILLKPACIPSRYSGYTHVYLTGDSKLANDMYDYLFLCVRPYRIWNRLGTCLWSTSALGGSKLGQVTFISQTYHQKRYLGFSADLASGCKF